ncbi:MAG TPA: S41 family peptidase, partial [Salinimicrobium sp.]|nr:S41 family peptidase [Salinimicrobium sp.]
VNMDSIVEVTVNSILRNLDPHSVYIPPEEYAILSESMEGDFVGIGVSFYNIKDTIAVIRPLEGGPSAKAGILGGDRILYANGQQLFGKNLSNDSLMSILKGEVNSKVTLQVYREGYPELLEFEVRRDHIPLKSVMAAYMLTDELGYINIDRFSETTYEEFKKALAKLKAKGATQLALDLRNNPGGYLIEATNIADEFLKDDKLILITKNKNGAVEKTYATEEGSFENGKVYVLINENSASAAEILTGALQDNDKGVIVGRRSYGKGLVQREMALGDGSAVRLTIARYYTPTGRSIQKPYDNGNKAYFNDHQKRIKNGELVYEDSIPIVDSLKYVTPGGNIVYGGGGIVPDVFVPQDTSFEMGSLKFLLRSGFMNRFIFTVLEKDRNFYNSLTFEEFKDNQPITNKIIQEFERFMEEEGYRLEVSTYRDVLTKYLKATMAQQLFGSNAFKQIMNKNNKAIEKVIELSKK